MARRELDLNETEDLTTWIPSNTCSFGVPGIPLVARKTVLLSASFLAWSYTHLVDPSTLGKKDDDTSRTFELYALWKWL